MSKKEVLEIEKESFKLEAKIRKLVVNCGNIRHNENYSQWSLFVLMQ